MFKSLVFAVGFTSLIAVCQAVDLCFYTSAACTGGNQCCIGLGFGVCCNSANPFCAAEQCTLCNAGRDMYDFGVSGCRGLTRACRTPCCNPLNNNPTCSGQVYRGTGGKRDNVEVDRHNETSVDGPDEECRFHAQPNKMTFTDEAGQDHAIHMSSGKAALAAELFKNSDWEGLEGFSCLG